MLEKVVQNKGMSTTEHRAVFPCWVFYTLDPIRKFFRKINNIINAQPHKIQFWHPQLVFLNDWLRVFVSQFHEPFIGKLMLRFWLIHGHNHLCQFHNQWIVLHYHAEAETVTLLLCKQVYCQACMHFCLVYHKRLALKEIMLRECALSKNIRTYNNFMASAWRYRFPLQSPFSANKVS